MRTIRIGSGAGFSNDRVEPGIELLEKDPDIGYNPYLVYRMKRILPAAVKNKVKVITNMGGANVEKAVAKTAEIARSFGITGVKIVGVLGDDIFSQLDRYDDCPIFETGWAI